MANIYQKYHDVQDLIRGTDEHAIVDAANQGQIDDLVDLVRNAPRVVWSIFPDTDELDIDTGIELVNVGTDAPDGVYDVTFDQAKASDVTDARVVVRNGMFDVKQTAKAATAARDEAGYWGDFLEALEYDSDQQIFRAYFGS